MRPDERLAEIKELIKFRLYHVADKKVNELYEDWTQGVIKLSERQEWLMFKFIDQIANNLYLGME